jgi:hypothetical protein
MVGDYNINFHVFQGDAGNRDQGFDNLIEGGIVQWVRPLTLVKTEDSDAYNTVLDFVFVANPPAGWSGQSRILEREGDQVATSHDFDDNSTTPDHRPVDAIFVLGGGDDDGDTPPVNGGSERIADILDRIDRLTDELEALREAVEDL